MANYSIRILLVCLAQSAYFATGAVFGLTEGLPHPVELISGRFDRRTIITILSALSAVIAAATLGG